MFGAIKDDGECLSVSNFEKTDGAPYSTLVKLCKGLWIKTPLKVGCHGVFHETFNSKQVCVISKGTKSFFLSSFRRNLLITLRGEVALSRNGAEIEPHETEISKTKEVEKRKK